MAIKFLSTVAVDTNVLYVDAAANKVGIGTTSPSQKLHVDGSARVTGAYYDSGNAPGTANQLLASTATGTAWIDPSTIVAEAATLVVIACKNTSGATIAQGTPVYQTGTVGATATIEIAPADALISANKLPAIGLLQTALNNNGFGNVVITGELTNFTTDPIDGLTPTVGDKVFVKSGGGLTLTKPTGEGNGIQNMGLVGKVSGGNAGSITVSSIMRTNDVPNLPEGRIWVGDGNTIVSDTVYIDEPNLRLGIGTTSPSNPLHIRADAPSIRIEDITSSDNHYLIGNNGELRIQSTGFITMRPGNTVSTAFLANGNVGIGTTSPSEKLEVSTVAKTVAKFTGNTDDGTGYVGAVVEIESNNDARGRGVYLTHRNSADTGPSEWYAGVPYTGVGYSIGNAAYGTSVNSNTGPAHKDQSKLFITETGNVGIGTTSPSDELTIEAETPTIKLKDISSSNYAEFYVNNFDTYLNSVGRTFIQNGGSTKVTVTSAGNVGIGTTSPNTALEVDGAISTTTSDYVQGTTGSRLLLETSGSGNTHSYIQAQSSGGTSNAEDLALQLYGGNVGIGTSSPSTTLDVAGSITTSGALIGPSLFEIIAQYSNRGRITLNSSTNTGANQISLLTDGVARMVVNKEGNIGIGDTSPSKKLTVNGQTQFYEYSGAHLTNAAHSNFNFDTLANNSSSSSGGSLGAFIKVTASPTGATGTWSAIRARAYAENTQGQTDNLINFFAEYRNYTSTNAVTLNHHAGLKVQSLGVGGLATVTNNYGVYLDVGTAATNNYGVYQAGTSVKNFFQGNVGIGTTSPTDKLDVSGNIKLKNTSDYIKFANDLVTIKRDGANFLMLNGYAGFKFYDTQNSSERMRIASSGNVGIGTTAPSEKLEVSGNIKLSSIGTGNSASSYGMLFYGTTSSGTQTDQAKIHSSPWATNSNGGNLQLYTSNASNALTERMRIDGAGNVGIGTTSPKAKLDVAGGVKVANDTDTATADKEGTLRYRLAPDVPKSQSMVDMCMKTGPSSYAWVNIVTNTWTN